MILSKQLSFPAAQDTESMTSHTFLPRQTEPWTLHYGTSVISSVGTYFGCAVDVLHGEDVPQAVQQNLGQSRDQLSGGDQHVHALPPAGGRHTDTRPHLEGKKSTHI